MANWFVLLERDADPLALIKLIAGGFRYRPFSRPDCCAHLQMSAFGNGPRQEPL